MSGNELERADALLHDAFLTLSSIRLDDGQLSVLGYTIRPAGLRLGKYSVALRIGHAKTYEVMDKANVDQLDVDEISYSGGALTIRGKMPVELKVLVDELAIRAEVSDAPFATRWLGRWRPVAERVPS